MEISFKFTIFLLLFTLEKVCQGCENCDEDYARRVDYLENLINKGINESNHYNLPNNADEYKPNSSQVFGKKYFCCYWVSCKSVHQQTMDRSISLSPVPDLPDL